MVQTLETRKRPPIQARWRPTEWLPPSAFDWKMVAESAESRRYYLTGPRPGDGSAASMYEWFTRASGSLGPDWDIDWRPDSERPVLTCKRGRVKVEVRRATDWFNEEAGPLECEYAMNRLAVMLADSFRGAVPLATPAMTGLDLWDRTVKYEYAPIPEDVRMLIHGTTGQGRIQICPPTRETIPALYHLDARLAYGAIGGDTLPVLFLEHDYSDEFLDYRPARYRIHFRVPRGWHHVGIFGVRTDEGGWRYPDQPGEEGSCWAEGCEVMLALRQGWGVAIRERLIFSTANQRPLDTWRLKLIAMRDGTGGLIDGALRSILLHGIGAFARRERAEVRLVANDDVDQWVQRSTDDGEVVGEQLVGDTWHIKVRRPLSSWSARYTHPEWSAHVWARMRCRVLSGPNGTGVLNLPRENVLAIETDGLYLTEDPGWTDRGKPGDFRIKGYAGGPISTPRSWGDLHSLRGMEVHHGG